MNIDTKRTKVLYVITKSVGGGAQRYVFDLATNLPKDMFETAVAVGGNGPLVQQLTEKNIPTYHVAHFQKSINPFKDIAVFFELLSIYKKFSPDIIHTNSSKAGGIASVATGLYRLQTRHSVPCIFTVHGWAFLETWRPWWQRFFIQLASKLTVMLHDHIIIISKRDQETTFAYNAVKPSKVTLIHNGVTDTVVLPRAQAQQELFGSEHNLVIGTIAEWTKNKGLEYLIAAIPAVLKKFPEAKLCLIGWGEENEKLKAKSEKLNIKNNIFFLSKSAAASYLKAFDIFVLPSLKEGLPYTLLEAGLAELPVIATRVGGIPEIIEDGTSGILISPASSQELAVSIIKLCKDKKLREELGKKNRQRILSQFSLSKMIEKTIAIYS